MGQEMRCVGLLSYKFEHKNSALLSSRTLVGWCYSFVIGVWIWLDGVAFALHLFPDGLEYIGLYRFAGGSGGGSDGSPLLFVRLDFDYI